MTGQGLVNQFAQLARQYSEDGAAQSGGDLGWVEKGRLDPDFEAAAWSLPAGKLSGIVKTQYGYHLVLVEASSRRKPAVRAGEVDDSRVAAPQRMAEIMTALGASPTICGGTARSRSIPRTSTSGAGGALGSCAASHSSPPARKA